MKHKWYESAVIYHIYSLSLSRASFNNNYSENKNTCAEIEKWIPHIKGMGFNAVLLSPVFKSRSHGYDVTDYFQIDNRIGTNEQFKELVKKFHDNGIKVVLDCVFNHCGRDFFAFQELKKNNRDFAPWFSGVDFSRQSPKGDHFDYDTWSGHHELPKFNLENETVKKHLLDAAIFYIETFDIDGMRLDAADVLNQNFMTDLRCITGELKNNFWLMGEVVHGDYSKWVNASRLHSVTNYKIYKSFYSSHNDNNLFELSNCVLNSVPDNGLPLNTFLDNHDISRIASVVTKPEYLKTLYTLLFTLPGIPSVYYGSEWGFKAVKEYGSDHSLRPFIDIDKRTDYSTDLTGLINKLIMIRQNNNALKYGNYKLVFLDYHRPFVFQRYYENERVYIAVNINGYNDTVKIYSGSNSGFYDLLNEEKILNPNHIQIKPFSARILI